MKKTIRMTVEKETKGTWRFSEEGPENEHVVGMLYLKKAALGEMKPKTLQIEMEIA